ncbi:Cullin-1 [Colletotrichum fructicola]|nr:Cullin-1 [Colletotrichum fructicola]
MSTASHPPGSSGSPDFRASVGTSSTAIDTGASRLRAPRSLPPWIDSYETRYGQATEDQLRLLSPPAPAVPPQHNHAPAEPDRRVSRDGYVDLAGDPFLENSRTRPKIKLTDVFRGKGAQHGRKWDHLRTADPVIVSKHRAATQGPPAAWRDFLQSSTYGHMEGEESEVVDASVLDKLQPDFNKRYDETMHRDVESKTSRRKQSKTIWKRLWSMVLRHYLIPLTFRLTVMVTSIIALAIAARIYKVENAKSGSSPERAQSIVAIAVDTVALPYIGYMLWDEYTGKPLGLRPAVQKISLILLDLFFIIFKSAMERRENMRRRVPVLPTQLLQLQQHPAPRETSCRLPPVGQHLIPPINGHDGLATLFCRTRYTTTTDTIRDPRVLTVEKMAPTIQQMPPVPNREDIGATWKYLEAGIQRIMLDLERGIDMQIYMGVYTAVHNFCTSQKAVGLSVPQGSIGSGNHRGAHLLGEELYNKLIEYLKSHLEGLVQQSKTHTDEALLTFYIKEWNRYTVAAKYIHHLFRYLNRHWVKREMDEGKKNIYDVYTLHLVQWRRVLFEDVSGKVMEAVLKLVEKQRNGETIEYGQIKQVVDSFVSLGLDDSDPTKSTLDVYRFHFEKPFLEHTKTYYQNESKQFVAENSVVEYMKKAAARLQEEEERVKMYLHADIINPLRKTCNQALIADHSQLLRDEFQVLLDNDREEDMARMYNLLSRIPEGLDPLRQRFETHVRKAGLGAVQKVASDAEKLEPKVYVDALLEIHSQYSGLVTRAFEAEAEFTRSLDNACREFINRNEVCKSGSNKSPELLAKYTDVLLRKSSTGIEEGELENTLTQIMTVFKYIEDKDVFQKFYSRMLARRLVHSNSSSDDAETSMISKLKEACGFEYTNKLQRMFQDMQTSKDLNVSFKEHVAGLGITKNALDSQYSILGTGFWPLTAPNTSFTPPAEINEDCERFARFYKNRHEGRKLTWLWQLCKGELKAGYCKNSKTPYTFQVSVYQMAILLMFNDKDKHTYEDIAGVTLLSSEVLDQALAILLKAKVLIISPDGKPEAGKSFRLNYDFKSKKIRVNLNLGGAKEAKQEEVETNKTIEEDRKLLLQSAIVRIMKARKKMKHTQLVSETINQIRSRFVPKVSDIKKCIEILLDKEGNTLLPLSIVYALDLRYTGTLRGDRQVGRTVTTVTPKMSDSTQLVLTAALQYYGERQP